MMLCRGAWTWSDLSRWGSGISWSIPVRASHLAWYLAAWRVRELSALCLLASVVPFLANTVPFLVSMVPFLANALATGKRQNTWLNCAPSSSFLPFFIFELSPKKFWPKWELDQHVCSIFDLKSCSSGYEHWKFRSEERRVGKECRL